MDEGLPVTLSEYESVGLDGLGAASTPKLPFYRPAVPSRVVFYSDPALVNSGSQGERPFLSYEGGFGGIMNHSEFWDSETPEHLLRSRARNVRPFFEHSILRRTRAGYEITPRLVNTPYPFPALLLRDSTLQEAFNALCFVLKVPLPVALPIEHGLQEVEDLFFQRFCFDPIAVSHLCVIYANLRSRGLIEPQPALEVPGMLGRLSNLSKDQQRVCTDSDTSSVRRVAAQVRGQLAELAAPLRLEREARLMREQLTPQVQSMLRDLADAHAHLLNPQPNRALDGGILYTLLYDQLMPRFKAFSPDAFTLDQALSCLEKEARELLPRVVMEVQLRTRKGFTLTTYQIEFLLDCFDKGQLVPDSPLWSLVFGSRCRLGWVIDVTAPLDKEWRSLESLSGLSSPNNELAMMYELSRRKSLGVGRTDEPPRASFAPVVLDEDEDDDDDLFPEERGDFSFY